MLVNRTAFLLEDLCSLFQTLKPAVIPPSDPSSCELCSPDFRQAIALERGCLATKEVLNQTGLVFLRDSFRNMLSNILPLIIIFVTCYTAGFNSFNVS